MLLTIMGLALSAAPALAKIPASTNISKADHLIPIQITGLNGNVVSFVILKNARDEDERGNAVKISGLYDTSRGKNAKCPYMLSSDVHKKVKNYNPFGGRAVVDATFTTQEQAKAAYDSKCVVIENVE
ncbi:MAG: hypothetical protein ACT4OY_06435 [Alphaproteobacteria bacterium]